MIINHNIHALMAWRSSVINGALAGKALERICSGKRINRAADDPAGLAISERMQAQIRGLQMASRNAQDGISMLQVAESGVNEVHSILQRMRELSVQAANGTNSSDEITAIQDELNELAKTINSISTDTEFNTIKLLNKSAENNGTLHLQTGPNSGEFFGIKLQDMSSSALKINGNDPNSALDISTPEKAGEAIKKIDDAIDKASSFRSSLGASMNSLEHRISYLDDAEINLTEAESRITDADIAKEMMEYTKYSMLQQVAQAMLAQILKQQQSTVDLLKSLL